MKKNNPSYQKDIKRLRELCVSFFSGWCIGESIVIVVKLLIGKFELSFIFLSLILGLSCVFIPYFIMKYMIWRKYKRVD